MKEVKEPVIGDRGLKRHLDEEFRLWHEGSSYLGVLVTCGNSFGCKKEENIYSIVEGDKIGIRRKKSTKQNVTPSMNFYEYQGH